MRASRRGSPTRTSRRSPTKSEGFANDVLLLPSVARTNKSNGQRHDGEELAQLLDGEGHLALYEAVNSHGPFFCDVLGNVRNSAMVANKVKVSWCQEPL